jgi:hypothetical protein
MKDEGGRMARQMANEQMAKSEHAASPFAHLLFAIGSSEGANDER